MLGERDVEVGQVFEGAARDACVGDRVAVVGDGDRAGVAQAGQLSELAALTAERYGADRQDARGAAARGVEHAGDHRRGVDGWHGVGHRADGRETAAAGGGRAGRDRFFVLLAGDAEVGVEVDEAGCDHEAGGVDFAVPGGEIDAQLHDAAVEDADVERGVEPNRRIDQTPAADQCVAAHDTPRTSKKSTAMRIARPAAT